MLVDASLVRPKRGEGRTAGKSRVLLVDEVELFRAGLRQALSRSDEVEVRGEARDASEALALASGSSFDVAVIEILLPGVSGISLSSQLRELQPTCRILGLSTVDGPGQIADMLRAGACGYALKTQPVDEILAAIRSVCVGARYLPPAVPREAIDKELEAPAWRPLAQLSPREREVFELLIRGFSNDEIGAHLFISRRTVEIHRLRISRKLSARSIAEMMRIAARHGLTQ